MAPVTLPSPSSSRRASPARHAAAYSFGVTPATALNRRWKRNRDRPAAVASSASGGTASPSATARSICRQAAATLAAWRSAGPAPSGPQRRQGRDPAAPAAAGGGVKADVGPPRPPGGAGGAAVHAGGRDGVDEGAVRRPVAPLHRRPARRVVKEGRDRQGRDGGVCCRGGHGSAPPLVRFGTGRPCAVARQVIEVMAAGTPGLAAGRSGSGGRIRVLPASVHRAGTDIGPRLGPLPTPAVDRTRRRRSAK